jgi:DNA-directed RNA polymerase sigma subunit (sigma70/sigma32)
MFRAVIIVVAKLLCNRPHLSQARQAQPSNPPREADLNRLFERWQQQDDRAARDELVSRFLPLARRLARRYAGAREPFDDLLQVASLVLVKAGFTDLAPAVARLGI